MGDPPQQQPPPPPPRPPGHIGNSLLWWLPPVILFVIAAIIDPVERLPSGSHASTVLTRLMIWCFVLAIVYVPAMICFRIVRRWLRH